MIHKEHEEELMLEEQQALRDEMRTAKEDDEVQGE